jgi:hypothetical membrane protein
MQPSQVIKTFTDRFPFVGPTMWMLSIQYYLIQVAVALDWKTSYSLAHNTISDLGNTACGIYDSRNVCSPLHSLMNASFVMLGVFMATGSLLIYHEFKKNKGSLVGFYFMALAGVGTLMVGLFPENVNSFLHSFGALLPFLLGNLGLAVLGFTLKVPASLRIYTLVSSFVSLVALVFFITDHYAGLGVGGMERLVAYPQTMWLIVFGLYISKNHVLNRSNNRSTKKVKIA